MNNNYMVTAQDVVEMLGVSKGHAYKIIRQLNKELVHTNIMEILDYDMPEKESAVVAFQKLKSALHLLGTACPFDKETFNLYCCEHTPKDIETS